MTCSIYLCADPNFPKRIMNRENMADIVTNEVALCGFKIL